MTHESFDRYNRRLEEAWQALWDALVDPADAWLDADGTCWLPLGASGTAACGPANESELAQVRAECRQLALSNEFAINGHENRISYIVGTGHMYRVSARARFLVEDGLCRSVQEVVDEFVWENQWQRRQQEIVRRRDRDGEAILRLFRGPGGKLRIRFVEPAQVYTPPQWQHDPAAALGILTSPEDAEDVQALFIDGEPVPVADVQHRKANVDGNVRRGLPLFYPVRKNLRRAEKLLRNMSVVAEIQSAIALVRKHHGATRAAVEQFVAGQAEVQPSAARPGRTTHFRRYAPGTILDAHGNVEYQFPTAGLDAGSFVRVLQAELRAIAARLVMPEFMLTSDASNANYASTMVAEGPAVRMFQRLQAEQIADDLDLLWRAVDWAVESGRLPAAARTHVEIQAEAPSLLVRDALREAQVSRIEFASGILSPQTWCLRQGLDYDQEQANLAQHAARIAKQG